MLNVSLSSSGYICGVCVLVGPLSPLFLLLDKHKISLSSSYLLLFPIHTVSFGAHFSISHQTSMSSSLQAILLSLSRLLFSSRSLTIMSALPLPLVEAFRPQSPRLPSDGESRVQPEVYPLHELSEDKSLAEPIEVSVVSSGTISFLLQFP